MITYEYKCPECESLKEVTRSIKEEAPNEFCDDCGSLMRSIVTGGHGFCMERVGGVTKYRKEGTEKAGARQDYIKKNPYSEAPDSLK